MFLQPVSNAAAVGRTGYASSLVFTPPICYQLCSCVVNQSRQPTCLKTKCVCSHMCQYKEDTRSCRAWFLVMIQPKDGPSDCKAVALGFTLIVKESNYIVTNSLKCTWLLCRPQTQKCQVHDFAGVEMFFTPFSYIALFGEFCLEGLCATASFQVEESINSSERRIFPFITCFFLHCLLSLRLCIESQNDWGWQRPLEINHSTSKQGQIE